MKIIIDRKDLANALAEVAPFTPQKPVLPILPNVKITTKGNRIKFEATDGRNTIRLYSMADEIDQDGSFLVDARLLSQFIQKSDGDKVTLSIENSTLNIRHPSGDADICTTPADEYPDVNIPTDNLKSVTMPSVLLSECVEFCKSSVGTDELRPTTKYIYAYIKDGSLSYCGTDTRRLTANCVESEAFVGIDMDWYIDPMIFSAITRLCKTSPTVRIDVAANTVSYRFGNTIISSQTPKGKFPDFKRVIPHDYPNMCVIDRKEFISAASRVALFCNQMGLCRLTFTMLDVEISADNLEKARRASESVTAHGHGEELTIGVQIDFLISLINAFDSDKLYIYTSDSAHPILIKDDETSAKVALVMPIIIQ